MISDIKQYIENFCYSDEQEIILQQLTKTQREEIHPFAQSKGLYTRSDAIQGEKDKKNMTLSKVPFSSPDENLNIIEFCDYYYDLILKSQKNKNKALDELFKILSNQDFDTKLVKCPTISNPIFTISYRDWNKLWKKTWHRQTRGTVMMLNTETNKFELLRLSLERNTEVLTGVQNKTVSKESLDLELNESDFDERQKFVIKCVNNNTIYDNAYVAGKTDGSLCTVNIFRGSQKEIGVNLNNCILCCGEIINSLCSKLDFVFTLSTKEAYLITEENSYKNIFTALLCGSEIISYENLKTEIKEKKLTLNQVLQKYLPYFVDKVKQFLDVYCQNQESEKIILNFEMVIPFLKTSMDNRDAWNNKASSPGGMVYEVPLFNFLGATFIESKSNNFFFKTHFEFQQKSSNIFFEPYYWKVETQEQLDNMLKDLSFVIRKKMTILDYIQKYRPINYFDKEEIRPFDFEGYIFSVLLKDELKSKYKNFEASKVKTEEYYVVHKPKYQDLQYLDELFVTSIEYFPDAVKRANKIKEFVPKVQPYFEKLPVFIETIRENNDNYPKVIELLANTPQFKKPDLKKLGDWSILINYWNSVFQDNEIMEIISKDKGKKYIFIEKIIDIVSIFFDKNTKSLVPKNEKVKERLDFMSNKIYWFLETIITNILIKNN
jgi:hypothetical protein